ncbi:MULTISPECIES: hypothetical protein [unclassified Streptomyces]
MNITEFLTDLQARHDKATVRAGELRSQMEDLTAELAPTGCGARPIRPS